MSDISYASSLKNKSPLINHFTVSQVNTPSVFIMPGSDGETVKQKVDGEITFYDMGGADGDINSYVNSLIVFEPANPNKTIEIEFQEIDLNEGAKIKLYSGEVSLSEEEDWGDIEYSLPFSGELAKISTGVKILKYRSAKLSGVLSVGFTDEYEGGSGKGWKAIVREVDAVAFDGIIISEEHKIVEISTAKHFYDNGGPDDNCTQGFEGQITFVPKEVDKKIMLDFKSFEIFNLYGPNNTIFRVYNGKKVTEDKLIGEYLNPPGEIRSSSIDGALTVYTKVKVSGTRSGWDAIVKQFIPSIMSVDQCLGLQSEAKEVMAGSKNIEVYALNIKTSNSLDALNVESIKFSTSGSSDAVNDIASAHLFVSKSFNDFTKAKAIGNKFDNPNGEFILKMNQELLEGNNYFWLVYDLKESAKDGNSFAAECLSVKCSSKDYLVSNADPKVVNLIKNVFKMKVGHSNVKVFGQFGFTDDDAQYGGKYGYGIHGDQIVTFKASNDNNMLQLDFSEFDIYFSKTQKTKFIVYAGTELKKENIIWELNSKDLANLGPVMHLRSNKKNKEMTILFNTYGASSYRTKKGWIAKVKEYQPSDMQLKDLKVEQAGTQSIKGGSVNIPLLKISMNLDGVLNPINLNSLFINTKNNSENALKYKLFATGRNNQFSASTLLGETSDQSSEIEIKGDLKLKEGKQYFWIAVDLALNAKIGDRIDASLVKLIAGGKEYIAKITDPDGDRLVVNELKLQKGDNIDCIVGETLVFYDDGGESGKYSNNFEGKVTFVPADKRMSMKLIFKDFGVSRRDYIKIYDGRDINDKSFIEEIYGYKCPSKEFRSSTEDGALTFVFSSNRYGNNKGWKAEISQYKPEILTVENISASHPSCATRVRGSKDVQFLKIKLDVDKDKGSVNIENFKFNISDKTKLALENVRLYYTENRDGFNNSQPFGEEIKVAENSLSFSDVKTLPKKDSYYLWFVADIKKSADLTSKLDVQLTSCSIDNKEILVEDGNPDGEIAIKAGHKGEYTIGSSDKADYHTFADAISFLKEGIEGNITFSIESGIYDEVIRIPHINGASEKAQIIFQSKTNNADDVIISSKKYSSPIYPDPNYGMFNVEGADYLTLKNLTFKTSNINYEAVVFVNNMSRHLTIKSNKIISETVDSGSFSGGSISLIETLAGREEENNNDYICIESNTLIGGHIGVSVGGTGVVSFSKEKGAIIKNNIFSKQGAKAIYLNNEDKAVVFENNITNSVTVKHGFQAIDLYRVIGESSVYNNKIILEGLTSCVGIELRGCTTDIVDKFPIYNNTIAINDCKESSSSFIINRDTRNISIIYNTACIKGNIQTSSRVFSIERGESSGLKVYNNIFQNKAGGHVYAVLNERFCKDYSFSNNVYFSSGKNIKYGKNNNFPLYEWKNKMNDKSSLLKEAEFYNDKDLHIRNSEALNMALLVAFISNDIDGDIRDVSHPFVGADEYNKPAEIPPIMHENYPKLQKISSSVAVSLVKMDKSGRIYYIVLDRSSKEPTIEQVKAGDFMDVIKDNESAISIDNLKGNHEYTLYFAIEDVFKNVSEKLSKLDVKTHYRPTSVSTFEEIEVGESDFVDATAHFTGFSVVKEKGPQYSYKIAKLDANKEGSVSLTNTDKGLKLEGFFLKSESSINIKGIKADNSISKETKLEACKEWKFICLHELGEVIKLKFSSSNKAFYIDDFSGKPLVLKYLGSESYRIKKDEKYVFEPKIEGGVEPFSIKWINQKTGEFSEGNSLSITPSCSNSYRMILTDLFGNTLTHKVAMNVTDELGVGSFEDLSLEDESFYWGDTDANSEMDYFYTDSYQLENCLVDKYATWGGFSYSNMTSKKFDPSAFLQDQFHSAAGGAACGTENFGVVYTLGTSTRMQLTNSEDDQVLSGMYITNTAWLVNSVNNGDPIIGEAFRDGDWYKIIAIGLNKYGEEISTTEFFLADYRDAKKHILVEDWQWWDLSSLGKISAIKFKSEGSRMNNKGLIIPAYFCIDEINNKKKEAPIVFNKIDNLEMHANSSESIAFSDIFPENIPEEEQSVEIISNSNDKVLSASVDNNSIILKSNKNLGGKIDISLKAKCLKHEEILNFSVNILVKKEIEVIIHKFKIFPNPVSRGENITIRCEWEKWNAQIFDLSGQLVIEFKSETNEKQMDLSNISTGMYILKIFTDSEQKTRRIIIQ
ncbi:MAG: DUF4465 domain-containing protein [Marinifilaceae bacterium]